MNLNLNIKMAEKSLKTIKNVFQTQAIIVAHSLYTQVISFDNFTDVLLGLFENYLICIFIIINIINYEKF